MKGNGKKMNFVELRNLIREESKNADTLFDDSGTTIQQKIFALDKNALKPLLYEIGTIPEDIGHDSSEEKLYAKTTDIVLAKTFHELGINATVNKERANCADVLGKSNQHGYTLVGDAKAFRLSRTAKNQKDFKVISMVDWKGDNDYSVLVCPYYQYPKSNSQIYGQALNGNVCLLSWEHLALFLEENIFESKKVNLAPIWNISSRIGEKVTIKDKDKNTNFHKMGNEFICKDLKIGSDKMERLFSNCRKGIIYRGEVEINFWKKRIVEIKEYTKEKAIVELITALKLNEKISAIKKFIDSLRD
jgi:type II restriction enzyme